MPLKTRIHNYVELRVTNQHSKILTSIAKTKGMTNKQQCMIHTKLNKPVIPNSHFAYKQSIIPFSRSNYTTTKEIA
jgi:hypothetical protein